nr:MAG TPA: hypothetical protein [Caudoviricetes sp.]
MRLGEGTRGLRPFPLFLPLPLFAMLRSGFFLALQT